MTPSPTSIRRAGETREPTNWLNYRASAWPGLQRDVLDSRPKGPNLLGELLWPVYAEVDHDAGTARLGLSHIAPTPEEP